MKLAASVAVLATGAAVVTGIALQSPDRNEDLVSADATHHASATPTPETTTSADPAQNERRRTISRAERRSAISDAAALVKGGRTAKTARAQATKMWTTETLNLWTAAGKGAVHQGEVKAIKPVYATGRHAAGREEIVLGNDIFWVTEGYLDDEKPKPEPAKPAQPEGIDAAPCPAAAGAESGLTPDAVTLLRTVCNKFPGVTSYGGWDAHGEHASGKAIDFMTTDKALGDQIAAYIQQNAAALNIYDVIWWDRIWTPVRSAEGWRDYGDHGSPTANHMDHVHAAVN